MLYIGLILLLLSGICQGSFGVGHKRHDPLSWECFWGAFSLNGILLTLILAALTVENLWEVVSSTPVNEILLPVLCGMAWGASTIAFSKAILMVGMSLCFGISMGVSAVIGTLIPFVMSGKIDVFSLLLLAAAVIITLMGIAAVTKGGLMKEEKSSRKNTKLGITLSAISGLCSGFQNVGFAGARSIGERCVNQFQGSIAQWMYILISGMATSLMICLIIAVKNKSLGSLSRKGSCRRLGIILFTSVLWLAASQLYGVSSKLLGENGEAVGWLVYNALALIISNFWGIRTGEWEDRSARRLLFIGDGVIILSWVVIAFV